MTACGFPMCLYFDRIVFLVRILWYILLHLKMSGWVFFIFVYFNLPLCKLVILNVLLYPICRKSYCIYKYRSDRSVNKMIVRFRSYTKYNTHLSINCVNIMYWQLIRSKYWRIDRLEANPTITRMIMYWKACKIIARITKIKIYRKLMHERNAHCNNSQSIFKSSLKITRKVHTCHTSSNMNINQTADYISEKKIWLKCVQWCPERHNGDTLSVDFSWKTVSFLYKIAYDPIRNGSVVFITWFRDGFYVNLYQFVQRLTCIVSNMALVLIVSSYLNKCHWNNIVRCSLRLFNLFRLCL